MFHDTPPPPLPYKKGGHLRNINYVFFMCNQGGFLENFKGTFTVWFSALFHEFNLYFFMSKVKTLLL